MTIKLQHYVLSCPLLVSAFFAVFPLVPRLANTPLGNSSVSDSGSPAHYQRLCGFGLAKDSTEKKTSRVDR